MDTSLRPGLLPGLMPLRPHTQGTVAGLPLLSRHSPHPHKIPTPSLWSSVTRRREVSPDQVPTGRWCAALLRTWSPCSARLPGESRPGPRRSRSPPSLGEGHRVLSGRMKSQGFSAGRFVYGRGGHCSPTHRGTESSPPDGRAANLGPADNVEDFTGFGRSMLAFVCFVFFPGTGLSSSASAAPAGGPGACSEQVGEGGAGSDLFAAASQKQCVIGLEL